MQWKTCMNISMAKYYSNISKVIQMTFDLSNHKRCSEWWWPLASRPLCASWTCLGHTIILADVTLMRVAPVHSSTVHNIVVIWSNLERGACMYRNNDPKKKKMLATTLVASCHSRGQKSPEFISWCLIIYPRSSCVYTLFLADSAVVFNWGWSNITHPAMDS